MYIIDCDMTVIVFFAFGKFVSVSSRSWAQLSGGDAATFGFGVSSSPPPPSIGLLGTRPSVRPDKSDHEDTEHDGAVVRGVRRVQGTEAELFESTELNDARNATKMAKSTSHWVAQITCRRTQERR